MKSGYGLLEGLVGWKAELEEGGGGEGELFGDWDKWGEGCGREGEILDLVD
jgi:hypothetical protein